jgi:hypothetical protein
VARAAFASALGGERHSVGAVRLSEVPTLLPTVVAVDSEAANRLYARRDFRVELEPGA